MKKIYLIGDIHTVSAFRLSGVEGEVSDRDNASSILDVIVRREDAGIVIITNELAGDLHTRIAEMNLERISPVIIEIPGIDDPPVMSKSVVGYIAEALGIAL